MSGRIIPEKEVQDKRIDFPDNYHIFYFKLLGIGKEVLKRSENQPLRVVGDYDGFFIVDAKKSIRQLLHSFIDKACNEGELP
jgi:hypothetical protein